MQPQDDRKLWDFLGQASQPQVSGKFTDDTLRRIRLESAREEATSSFSWLGWLQHSWRTLGGITTGVALLTVLFAWQNTLVPSPDSALLSTAPVDDPAAFKDLDLVLNDNELWLGTISY